MKTVEFIYVGQGGKGQKYVEMPGNNSVTFSKKLLGYEMIGSIVSAEHKGGPSYGKFKPAGRVSEELHPELNEEVERWTAEHRARLEVKKAENEAKKEHSNSIETKIKELKEHTWNMSKRQKANYALWVYNELMK